MFEFHDFISEFFTNLSNHFVAPDHSSYGCEFPMNYNLAILIHVTNKRFFCKNLNAINDNIVELMKLLESD